MSCAAKFIPLRSKTRAQAYQERDILATLSHPLITGLLDQFETRKTLILILELYPAPGPLGEFTRHWVPRLGLELLSVGSVDLGAIVTTTTPASKQPVPDAVTVCDNRA